MSNNKEEGIRDVFFEEHVREIYLYTSSFNSILLKKLFNLPDYNISDNHSIKSSVFYDYLKVIKKNNIKRNDILDFIENASNIFEQNCEIFTRLVLLTIYRDIPRKSYYAFAENPEESLKSIESMRVNKIQKLVKE